MQLKHFKIELEKLKNKNNHEHTVAILTIQRPPLNALSNEVLEELKLILDKIETMANALIITGEGKAFIAGADIAEMKNLDEVNALKFAQMGQAVFSHLENIKIPTIAAVNGFALGGGLELALSCDIRIFSEKAVAGLPEVSLGLIPGFGGTQRLARHIGEGNAKFYTLTAEKFSASEALRMGLAQQLATPEELLAKAKACALLILNNSRLAISKAKRLVLFSDDASIMEGLSREAQDFSSLFKSNDVREGIAAFLEKRSPNF